MKILDARAGARFARLCLLGAGLGLVACSGAADVTLPVTVTLLSSGAVSMSVGDTITVRAQVQNAHGTGVSYSTSNPAVADVDPLTGLVRATGPGDAVVTASSVDEPTAKVTVQVRVQDRPSAVAIDRIANAAGTQVDPAGVQGGIYVQLALELGSATRLEVLLDTVVVCQRNYTAGVPAASAAGGAAALAIADNCFIDTGVFDATTGTPKFQNGPAVISARLLGPEGRVRSNANGYSVTLRNPARIVADVTAGRATTDSTGLAWRDGDVTVNVTPVVYDRNVGIARVEATYTTPAGTPFTLASTAAPFRLVFTENGPLKDITDPAFSVSIRSVTTLGEVGPSLATSPARYDNQAPPPGTIRARDWVGSETVFQQTYTPAAQPDRGVGRIKVRFFAGDPVLSDSALVTRGVEVTTGADLPQSTGTYRLAALVCDALENCVGVPGFNFRVDRTAPTIESVSLKDRAVNPPGTLTLGLQDELSGFDALPVEAIVRTLDRTSATLRCGPEVDGVNLPGRLSTSGACIPDTVGSQIPIPTNSAGYYSYSLTPFDRAGNHGPTVTRTFLVDHARPELTSFQVPTQAAGDEGTVSASATDDLDLTDISFRLVFGASGGGTPVALSFDTASTAVGVAFDAVLTQQATRIARFPLIRTLTVTAGTGRATVLVDSVQVQAVDAAGQTATLSKPLVPSASSIADPFPTVAGPALINVIGATTICTAVCQSSESTSLRLEMHITGTKDIKTTPFARVYFYRRDLVTGVSTLLGSLSGDRGTGDTSGIPPFFTYPLTFTPPPGLTGAFDVFAVGITSGGSALRSDSQRVNFVQH